MRLGFVAPLLAIVTALAVGLHPAAADARGSGSGTTKHRGRPTVTLDQLHFPKDVRGHRAYRKFLRRTLRREARRADWGAGRGAKITYRFYVKKLTISEENGVLRVTCTAVGRLPKGKAAKSQLSFGGDPRKRGKVVRSVLEIVSRGVMTRLAELERVRRGDLNPSRVRRPTGG